MIKIINLDNLKIKRRKLTKIQKERILKAYGYHCALQDCYSDNQKLHLDNTEFHHRIPLWRGGTNEISNFAPLCKFCHKFASNNLNSPYNYFVKLKPIPSILKK